MFSRTLVNLALLPTALAWGQDAHAVIAHIADTRISAATRKAVDELMGEGVRLADWSSWADNVRSEDEWSWTGGLHFINVPPTTCAFNYARDCKDDYCVAGAIRNFTSQVGDSTLSIEDRRNALQFLVHFMGDIHQPLHVGQTVDLGGNTIEIHMEFADKVNHNLHRVWDWKLIDEFEASKYNGEYIYQSYETAADNRTEFWSLTFDSVNEALKDGGRYAEHVESWVEDCQPMGWEACVDSFAQESAKVSCEKAYRDVDETLVESGDTLSMKYYDSRNPTVFDQLAKAGVRLAYILETSLAATTSTTAAPASTTAAPSITSTTPDSSASSVGTCATVMVAVLAATFFG